MPRSNDNWEKLVAAVLRREADRALAHCESFSSISDSGESSSSRSLQEPEPVFYSGSITIDENLKSVLPPGQDEIVWTCLATSSMDRKKCFKIGKHDVREDLNGNFFHPSYHHYLKTKDSLTVGPKGLLGLKPYYKYSYSKSRLSGVAYQQNGLVDIRGKIEKQRLSWNTTYGAYLVYSISKEKIDGQDILSCERALECGIASIRSVNDNEVDEEVDHMEKMRRRNKLKINSRPDRKNEIEMGEFDIDDRNQSGMVEARFEAKILSKSYILDIYLTFVGIEFRPIAEIDPFRHMSRSYMCEI